MVTLRRYTVILLLVLSYSLYSQPIIGVVASSNQAARHEIKYQWNFEPYSLGDFGIDSVAKYFNVVDPGGPDWAETDIVNDTINGEPTQALRVFMEGGEAQQGLQAPFWYDNAQTEFDSICQTFDFKFGKDFEAISGNGKLLGMRVANAPRSASPPCAAENGVTSSFLYKAGFRMSDYHYDWIVQNGSCPWTSDQFPPIWEHDSVWFIPGVWYALTVCVRINTISSGTAQEDGISETWINGNMIYQNDDIGFVARPDTMQWDAVRFSSFSSAPDHTIDSYLYYDNITMWMPVGDTAFDGAGVHDPSYKMISPVDITNKTVYYDTLINLAVQSPDTAYTTGYPSAVGAGYTAAWTVDAGVGNTVTATILGGDIGSNDFLFFYDGDQSDDVQLARIEQAANIESYGPYESTGQKLSFYTVNSEAGNATNFAIKVIITP